MNSLYVCKEYETPYEEGYRVVRTIEEHNKIIYNQALEDFAEKILNWKSQNEEYRSFEDVVNEIKEELNK